MKSIIGSIPPGSNAKPQKRLFFKRRFYIAIKFIINFTYGFCKVGAGVGVGIGSGPTGGVGFISGDGIGEEDGAGDGLGLGLAVGEGVGVGVCVTLLVLIVPPPVETATVPPTKNIKRTADKQKRPAALIRSNDLNLISSLRVRSCRFYLYDMHFGVEDASLINHSGFYSAFDPF